MPPGRLRYLIVCVGLVAATREARSDRVGLEVAGQYSVFDQVTTEPTDGFIVDVESHGRWAPAIGLKLDHDAGRGVHLQPELRWVERAERTSVAAQFGASEQVLRERQLSFLALVRYYPRPWGFLTLGPEFAYLLSGKVSGTYTYSTPRPGQANFDFDYTDQTSRWDLLLVVGTGPSWSVAGHVVSVEARFVQSLVAKDRPGINVGMFGNAIPWTDPSYPFTTNTSRTQAVEIAGSFVW